jgi:predicted HD phosphohydrolase
MPSSVQEAEQFARDLIQKNELHPAWMRKEYLLEHIQAVIEDALLLSGGEYETEFHIAGWLHDLGRVEIDEGHAKRSHKLSEEFLETLSLSEKQKEIVTDCILHHGSRDRPLTEAGRFFQTADKLAKFNEQEIAYDSRTKTKEEVLASLQKKHEKLNRINNDKANEIAERRIQKVREEYPNRN